MNIPPSFGNGFSEGGGFYLTGTSLILQATSQVDVYGHLATAVGMLA